MATETRHSGTLRTDYEADRAKLDDLRPLTADTDILLHRLTEASRKMSYLDVDGREGTLTPLLENHVLTVLADIRRKKLSGYGGTFAGAQGTMAQTSYAQKLEEDVQRWKKRLEAYLHTAFTKGLTASTAVQTARELLTLLDNALQGTADQDNRRYYRMLRTVTAIQENADRYWQQAVDSGDTEPALALLLAYLKNYTSIAEDFNRRFASLPELYRREVLHAVPTEAVPDNTYLVITPAGKGFTLKKGTAFTAGENRTYQTTREEYICAMRYVQLQTTYRDDSGLHLQTLHPENTTHAETLFAGGEELRTGWQIESPMLVLEEGTRKVGIQFLLNDSQPDNGMKQGFTVEYATAEGWTEANASCELSGHALTFSFTLARDSSAPTPCNTELHGTETTYPVLRILTANGAYPIWADGLEFDSVQITVEVSGIRNFTFVNELGETDTTQPFAPFGIQAERGAWFLFGNEETNQKTLREVTLTGTWQKLPETRSAFNQLYKDYPAVDASSFHIKTAYQKDGQWQTAEDRQALFDFDEKDNFKPARFVFDFPRKIAFTSHSPEDTYEYTRDKDGFFRVTLESPAIGFGITAYRNRFTEVMVHNSHCKKKDLWTLPHEPSLPLLADAAMGYKAEQVIYSHAESPAAFPKNRIIPINIAKNSDTPPREGLGRLLPQYPASRLLYFAFTGATGERRMRIYLDMALPHNTLPYYNPDPDTTAQAVWQYWKGTEWQTLSSQNIISDETAGLTQSGFVEIELAEEIKAEWLDKQKQLWLRVALVPRGKDVPACLGLRNVWINCIRVTADGGDGSSLSAGTIQGTQEEDARIGSVMQPLPGFGGIPAGTEVQQASHQTARFANRHRAVTQHDYEQILLEYFPKVDLAQCLTLPPKQGGKRAAEVCIVVFSRTEDNRYFLSPLWKLKEMENTLKRYAPACVSIRVFNPLYEQVTIRCTATLHSGVTDKEKVMADLTKIAEGYLSPWRQKGCFPVPGQVFSVRELQSRMMNHEDLQRMYVLSVNGEECSESGNDLICGEKPWSVLLPKVEFTFSETNKGVGSSGIGSGFIIG